MLWGEKDRGTLLAAAKNCRWPMHCLFCLNGRLVTAAEDADPRLDFLHTRPPLLQCIWWLGAILCGRRHLATPEHGSDEHEKADHQSTHDASHQSSHVQRFLLALIDGLVADESLRSEEAHLACQHSLRGNISILTLWDTLAPRGNGLQPTARWTCCMKHIIRGFAGSLFACEICRAEHALVALEYWRRRLKALTTLWCARGLRGHDATLCTSRGIHIHAWSQTRYLRAHECWRA
mmetsp:Transcript_1267/g.2960  ORF Transcript_1267/g.2960 Transcript_1267/m.2960 type:complete len:235 (-) Transcript_1267:2090-2794(-)